jgi:endonuclease/exonuclease/phosphatase (EEP) superfamily protein YafD
LALIVDSAVATSPQATVRRRAGFGSQLARLIEIFGWLYFVFVLMVWGSLVYGADRHWLGTLIEFGPRWMLLIPLIPLVLAALCWQRRMWWSSGITLYVILAPVCGLNLPWSMLFAPEPATVQLRVLTLNTDGVAKPADVLALVEEHQVDVVFLQECRNVDLWARQFGPDWQVRAQAEFIVAARHPLTDLEPLLIENAPPGARHFAARCQLSTALGSVNLVALHTYSPRRGLAAIRHREPNALQTLERNTQRRAREASAVASWCASLRGPTIIAGDFNQAAGSSAFAAHWGRYSDAFSVAGIGWGATFYSRWHGVRIDHVLVSTAWQPVACWPARDVGSAHRPLIATLYASQATFH